jgi:hypothetical protein
MVFEGGRRPGRRWLTFVATRGPEPRTAIRRLQPVPAGWFSAPDATLSSYWAAAVPFMSPYRADKLRMLEARLAEVRGQRRAFMLSEYEQLSEVDALEVSSAEQDYLLRELAATRQALALVRRALKRLDLPTNTPANPIGAFDRP